MFLAVVMMLSIFSLPALADGYEKYSDNGFTVEIVPNEIAEKELPEDLLAALHSETYNTHGATAPTEKSLWNLSSKEYTFHVKTQKDKNTIYSNYVFTGHDGKITVSFTDYVTDSGKFTFKVYKRGLISTRIYQVDCENGSTKSYDIDIKDADALVYFSFTSTSTTMDIDNGRVVKGK